MKDVLQRIYDLGWMVKVFVHRNGIEFELENLSPAGEDLIISLTEKNMLEELKTLYETYDAEQHAVMWYGRNRGEPSSLRVLLDDSERIEDMYRELYLTVKEAMEEC